MTSTVRYGVTGMTCSHCVQAVTEELSAVPGVTDVEVQLVPQGASTVTVSSEHPVDEGLVRAAVDEAGYELATVGSAEAGS